MTNTSVATMPTWILFAVPVVAVSSMTCAIAFGSNPIIAQLAGIASLFSIAASFVIVPVTIYTLAAKRKLRTIPQLIGISVCSLPILGVIASFLSGSI